MNNKVLNLTGN